MVGTMAPAETAPESARLLPVDAPGLQGSVSVVPEKDGWKLVFDLESAGSRVGQRDLRSEPPAPRGL
jgi:hypothetical protein